jgi:hypothetical protein
MCIVILNGISRVAWIAYIDMAVIVAVLRVDIGRLKMTMIYAISLNRGRKPNER